MPCRPALQAMRKQLNAGLRALGVAFERTADVPRLAIDPRRQRRLRKPGAIAVRAADALAHRHLLSPSVA